MMRSVILLRRSFASLSSATKELGDGIVQRDIRSLAKGITLGSCVMFFQQRCDVWFFCDRDRATTVESLRHDHQEQAHCLLDYVSSIVPKRTIEQQAFRLGVTGPPGVGKRDGTFAFCWFVISHNCQASRLLSKHLVVTLLIKAIN